METNDDKTIKYIIYPFDDATTIKCSVLPLSIIIYYIYGLMYSMVLLIIAVLHLWRIQRDIKLSPTSGYGCSSQSLPPPHTHTHTLDILQYSPWDKRCISVLRFCLKSKPMP